MRNASHALTYFSWGYNYLVRVKTSVTLPEDLLKRIDRAGSNRSTFLESAAREYLSQLEKDQRDTHDAAILDSRADQLNREALDVLKYQDLD